MKQKQNILASIASEGIDFLTEKVEVLIIQLKNAKTMDQEIELELDIEGFGEEIELLKKYCI